MVDEEEFYRSHLKRERRCLILLAIDLDKLLRTKQEVISQGKLILINYLQPQAPYFVSEFTQESSKNFAEASGEEPKTLEAAKSLFLHLVTFTKTLSFCEQIETFSFLSLFRVIKWHEEFDFPNWIWENLEQKELLGAEKEGWNLFAEHGGNMCSSKGDCYKLAAMVPLPCKEVAVSFLSSSAAKYWDPMVRVSRVVERKGLSLDFVYHQIQLPKWLFLHKNREVTYLRRTKIKEDGTVLIIWCSVVHPSCPPSRELKQMCGFYAGAMIRSSGENMSNVYFSYSTMPSGRVITFFKRRFIKRVALLFRLEKVVLKIHSDPAFQEEREYLLDKMKKQSSTEIQLNFSKLNDIKVKHKLGAGSFGEVYYGEWLNSPVALKRLKSEGHMADFKAEAATLEAISHPHVVQFHGIFCDTDNSQYIVMEHLPEGNLRTFLRERVNQVLLDDLFKMVVQVASGMTYLHERGIIHRDLACRNILVSRVQEKLAVKIGDFGMSKNMSEYKKSGALLPVRWSAPEALSDGHFSPKSDVFSFYVVIWEMLHFGETPFQWILSNSEVCSLVQSGVRLPEPRNIAPELLRCMRECSKELPSERPSFVDILELLGSATLGDCNSSETESEGDDSSGTFSAYLPPGCNSEAH